MSLVAEYLQINFSFRHFCNLVANLAQNLESSKAFLRAVECADQQIAFCKQLDPSRSMQLMLIVVLILEAYRAVLLVLEIINILNLDNELYNRLRVDRQALFTIIYSI